MSEEEDGTKVTGISGILILGRGRPKQIKFVRKKCRNKERAREGKESDCDMV